MDEKIALQGDSFRIVESVPLYDGLTDPIRIGNINFILAIHTHQPQVVYVHPCRGLVREPAADVIEGCLIWCQEGAALCLISVPNGLTGAQRRWSQTLIECASNTDALQTVLTALNDAPGLWP